MIIQSVDYSYSDYDYQPEEGRSLGAEDEYYEDAAPARAYNFQFQVCSFENAHICAGSDLIQHREKNRAGKRSRTRMVW